jgi:uncharacterized protein YndB with AHSA1/START domain
MARWIPPNGFTGKVHHMDAKVGGSFKMSFTNFTTGTSIGFGGEYLELVPHESLRYTDVFDDPNLTGVMTVTVSLKSLLCTSDVWIMLSVGVAKVAFNHLRRRALIEHEVVERHTAVRRVPDLAHTCTICSAVSCQLPNTTKPHCAAKTTA